MQVSDATGLMALKQAQIQRALTIAANTAPHEISLSLASLLKEAAAAARDDGLGGLVDRSA